MVGFSAVTKRALLSFGALYSSFCCGFPVADFISSVELENETGFDKAVRLGPNDEDPFGVLYAFSEQEVIGFCNCFHGWESEARSRAFTARHCISRAIESGAKEFHIIYRDNRSSVLSSFEVVGRAVWWSLDIQPGVSYTADLVALPVPAKKTKRWGQVAFLDPQAKEGDKYLLWAFEPSGREERKARMKKYSLRGVIGHSPRIKVRWRLDSKTFEKEYLLSYSRQGGQLDERYGLFLEGEFPSRGASGALITSEREEPVALFHTTITTSVFKQTWEKQLRRRFKRHWIQHHGAEIEEKRFSEGEIRFSLISKLAPKEKPFILKGDVPLYMVATPVSVFSDEEIKRYQQRLNHF